MLNLFITHCQHYVVKFNCTFNNFCFQYGGWGRNTNNVTIFVSWEVFKGFHKIQIELLMNITVNTEILIIVTSYIDVFPLDY